MASASTSATEDPIEALQRTGAQLLALISDLPTEAARIKSFVKEYDAQAWLQDPRTGWTALHYAALRNDWPLAEFLIRRANAKWEIVDHTGAVRCFVYLLSPARWALPTKLTLFIKRVLQILHTA